MTRMHWFVMAALALALAGGLVTLACAGDSATGNDAIQVAQAGGGDRPGWGPPPEMTEAERARMREQMLERMLDRAGLTDDEKTAARAAMKAKAQANEALAGELDKLRPIADNEAATDQQLRDALAAYRAALADCRKKNQAADQALAAKLSIRAQVRCTSLGILDNGLGGLGQQRRFGMGGGGRGPRPPR